MVSPAPSAPIGSTRADFFSAAAAGTHDAATASPALRKRVVQYSQALAIGRGSHHHRRHALIRESQDEIRKILPAKP